MGFCRLAHLDGPQSGLKEVVEPVEHPPVQQRAVHGLDVVSGALGRREMRGAVETLGPALKENHAPDQNLTQGRLKLLTYWKTD
jgi:hypothetical protein